MKIIHYTLLVKICCLQKNILLKQRSIHLPEEITLLCLYFTYADLRNAVHDYGDCLVRKSIKSHFVLVLFDLYRASLNRELRSTVFGDLFVHFELYNFRL